MTESTLEELLNADMERVEDLLHQSVTGSSQLVDELTSHLSSAGGKRMRPMLALICAQLGSPEATASQAVIDAATAVELTHLATLYHDDVMDSAPQRRGVPAAQHQWGNNRAILAGDVLFARASRLVAALGQRTIDYHARTFERLCLGQLNETFGPQNNEDPVEFYIQVLADKTGSLINTAAVFGAWHGGAADAVAEAVGLYGERIGVAFQLADDVIDLTSDGSVSGKTPGTDLVEGVVTLPILLLRERLSAGQLDADGQKLLADIDSDLTDPERLASVVARLGASEVVEETRRIAREWADSAVAALEPLPDSTAKQALIDLAQLMVDRMN
ncbi:MAG: polyprenyl synthetase family protein [Actinomycetaceae bacterium]|nr:polyprenyl synthetase family protein [Actinomycetaceae bacterium]